MKFALLAATIVAAADLTEFTDDQITKIAADNKANEYLKACPGSDGAECKGFSNDLTTCGVFVANGNTSLAYCVAKADCNKGLVAGQYPALSTAEFTYKYE